MTVAAKLIGGEELDRSIAIDTFYRNAAYTDYDNRTRERLGQAVKTTMYAGQNPTEEQVMSFMSDYTAAGGDPKNFNRWLMKENKNANSSNLNRLKYHINSPQGRRQAQIMGADTDDFWYNPPAPPAEQSQGGQ
jgi:hypothetical protein